MGSNPLFPFERNRYYSGKMLTSADFAAEQLYINNKNSFINYHMFGTGIVCGCNVNLIDETTILVESGLAIDSWGREIVIDSSVVKKLAAIPGFEDTKSNNLVLGLRYKEEVSQPVYAVSRAGAESKYEYNRIQERYELVVKDVIDTKEKKAKDSFLVEKTLWQDENYRLSCKIPGTVCENTDVKIQFKLAKLSQEQGEFNLEGSFQMPSFVTQTGTHELDVKFEGVSLEQWETILQEYWVEVAEVKSTESNLIWKTKKINSLEDTTGEVSLKVKNSGLNPQGLINYQVAKAGLEEEKQVKQDEYVSLAFLTVLRKEGNCYLADIEEETAKKYIEAPAKNYLRNEYLTYFRKTEAIKEVKKEETVAENVVSNFSQLENTREIATGTIEIPIGGKAKMGEVFYSGEVMHGLGPGTVYVEIGQEILEEDKVKGANTKSTIYGNSKLFAQTKEMLPKAETAVKVLNDKGSFIAAVSFAEDTECLMITYRWVAFKIDDGDKVDVEENTDKQWIEAQTPTVVLGTRESYYFGVKFHEMDKCNIIYQVTEEDGGEITVDGIYTAPNREGVFEIMISCAERPYICTYAYAIVKKK